MHITRQSILASLIAATALAAGASKLKYTPPSATHPFPNDPKLDIAVSFDSQSPLGVTIVNNHITKLDITVDNNEPVPVSLEMVGGSLWDSEHTKRISNLTAVKVGSVVESKKQHRIAYSFITDVQPQDMVLELGLVMTLNGTAFTKVAYNGTVSVVEPETSLLDPQLLFLYVVLLGVVSGIGYFAYSTWVVPLLPKKPKRKQQQPTAEVIRVTSADVATGSDKYDQSWIPEGHITKKSSTRVRSGTPRSKGSKRTE